MTDPDALDRYRRFYAALVTRRGGGAEPRVEAAFAAVPREAFAGPGPWWILAGDGYVRTPDADPAFLYQDVLIALDRARGIHNGEPSLHARCLAALAVEPGARVVHVGAGGGYYTAILATLAGPAGTVDAYEIEPFLAAAAAANLAPYPTVRVHAASGVGAALAEADAIYVNAGTTRPERTWLAALRPHGRLLFPLTDSAGRGGMLLVTAGPAGDSAGGAFAARFVTPARFIPCNGARDDSTARRLVAAFAGNALERVARLVLDRPPDASCWFCGGDWWLAAATPAAGDAPTP